MRLLFPVLIFIFLAFNKVTDIKEIRVLDYKNLEPRLHLYNDTTYIVNFWATWCIPCRKELPDFEKVNSLYKDKKVKVLLVSLDFPEDTEKVLLPFVEKYNLQSEIVLLDDVNSNYWIPRVDTEWNGNIPATLIYNKNYREFFPQLLTYDDLDSILNLNMIKL
ncbi:MAG: TlpA family protein disulfide reductase [Bacteroidales bacterium]|nr:TlpA family protein disulfide reductase [Bacteroidales bacterium]